MKKILQIIILTAITGLFAINDISAQTLMPIPAPSSGYSGNTRGMWFLAPCNFRIVGLRVPTTYSSANSYITVVDFGTTAPPTYSTTTNSFTTLTYLTNIAGSSIISVNLPVVSGHYIGIMGCRGSISNYTAVTTSYPTTINGFSTSLYRLGMQYDLTTTAPKELWYEANTVAVVEMYYVANYKVDAGISVMNTPATVITPGTANVTATLKNFGTDTLKSAALRWSVNGSLQTSPSNWSGTLLKDSTNGPISFGSYNFGVGIHTLKAWTNSPNGKLDSNAYNDTSTSTIYSCNPASGTYVIDPSGSGDFKTFNIALNWIKNCGVGGPVTFRVKRGIYTEQLTIPPITGASATNKITFESYDLDSTKVTLTYAAISTTDNWVVRFNGCSYVTFRKMTISATGSANGYVVEYISGANYDNLENNILQCPVTTLSTYAGVYSSTTADQYNTIKYNVITGGYYGIYFYGVSTTSLEAGNVFEGNMISDAYMQGIIAVNQDAVKIKKNMIIITSASATVYGINCSYCNNNIEITQNNLQLSPTGIIYGLNISNSTGTTTLIGNVSNNFVSTFGSSVTTIYALNITTVSYMSINYNSVSISNTVASSRSFNITGGTASTVNVLNNNFINLGGGYAIYTGSATTALGTCNYNNLFSSATNLGYWTANTTTLAAWRTASAKDANSVSLNPNFATNTNLHVNSAGISGMGTPVSGFTVDIDDETRQNPPDIGADEFNLVPNDAGVSSMAAPLAPCSGSNVISAKVKNYGSATLTSVTIGWSVNGVNQTPVTSTTISLTQNQEASINVGSYTFVQGLYYNIKFWASQPNGVTDGNAKNDTFLYKNLTTSFGGYYTIGGTSANYPTIAAALADLKTKGICSPTTIRINSGTYTGRIVIPPIPGASAVNRVTFDGGSADSTKIVFNNPSSLTTLYAAISLNGADYITIKNLTIENTHVTYACGIYIGNQAQYNVIENCVVTVGNVSTASYAIPIMGSGAEATPTTNGDMGNYNTIRNNRLIGGYYGMRFYGLSAAPYTLNLQIIGNTIEQFYNYGAYIYYSRNLLFKSNRVIKPRYAYAYGIYSYYAYNSIYDANIINPGNYGMMIYYNQNVAPDSTIISNNIITNFMNGTYQVGIYCYSNYRAHIFNNSIWCDGTYTSTTSYGCIYNYSSQYCVIKNNILKATGNLNCYTVSGATMAAGSIDYNNYIASSSASVAYTGTTYATLLLWKSADPTQNMNSISVEPKFVDYKDLHLQSTSPLMLGKKMAFPYDVDGDTRCEIATTLGADEFHYTAMPPTAGFTTTDSTCENTPLYFWNLASANDVTKNSWLVNGVLKSTSLNFSYTPDTSGIDTISIITANCFGADTFTKIIKVVKPTQLPVSAFMASKNRVKIGEMLRLGDLTTNCPSTWDWNIMPDTTLDLVTGLRQPSYTFLNGTTRYSANPEFQFNYSGLYDVSLATSNVVGTGTTETKLQYISVVFSGAMCIGSNTTDEPEGFLYDNGGKNLNYTANKFCTYTIHPCADSVSINFAKFILTSGDYLRIYDGTNNQGTPLWNKKLYKYGMGNAVPASYPTTNDVFTAHSGAMYIEFETDATLVAEGFEAIWASTAGNFTPPVADFTTADSNCNGSHVFFENTSTGTDNRYFWDFDNNGQYESNLQNPYWIYKADGIYKVKLAVVNCGGTDTTSKLLTIYTSQNKPTFNIAATNQRPNLAKEIVYLSGNPVTDCIDTFNWIITPKSYTIVSGDIHSQTVGIIFNDSVCYDVTLISGYRGMMDTMFYPCYILPIEYCIPGFSYFTPDIGISRVKFAEIDQASEPGMQAFEDFTNTKTALLEYGVTYPFIVSRNSSYNYIQRKIWIDYNIDGDFNEAGEMVAIDTISNSLTTWIGSFKIPQTAREGLSRLRVGVSAINQQLGPCSILNDGEYEDYSVLLSKNVTPPVITLTGSALIHMQQCGTYTEPGATSLNQLGNTEPVTITGSVDPQIAKTYYIKYNSVDVFGNKAIEKIRTVIVDKDSIVPEFKLNGKIYDTILVHNNFNEPLYVASDSCAGLESVKINSSLNIHLLGSYTINYTAKDYNGNSITLTRYIKVMDNIPPDITVFDPDTILMEVNTALNPRVLKITDNYNTTFSIVTTGTFYQNFNTGLATSIGLYTIIYTVSDESGNLAVKKFWIKVGDQTNPTIILNGSRIISLCLYDTIDEKGYVAEDNIDPNPKVTRTGSYLTDYMLHFAVGTYEIKYTVMDFTGNYSSVSRLIYVINNGPCATSIQEAINKNFSVYPNPTSGMLNLFVDVPGNDQTSVQIFNAIGKSVYTSNLQSGKIVQVDLSTFANGIYTVQFSSNGLKNTQKVSVIH
jgi:PKD repeat protein